MISNKKGSELSMNVIIIAAIALLVLVILAVLLMGKSSDLSKSCANIGGICDEDLTCASVSNSGEVRIPKPDSSCGDGKVCCITLSKE